MLMLTQLIGFGAGRGAATPASYVFNGTDEAMVRTLSTSGASTTIFTYSLWIKVIAYTGGDCEVFLVVNDPTNTQFLVCNVGASGDQFGLAQDSGAVDWGETALALTPDIATGTWEHWVFRYDSTQATADDRIRMYRNGTLVTDTNTASGAPALNEAHVLFQNGFQHQIGGWPGFGTFGNQKLAFIEVLDGVSAAPTDFAFLNGATWTRKLYTGSYGTHGFKLDGTSLFNDVSGNGQNFTGTNMDATNLDTADLPPYTN